MWRKWFPWTWVVKNVAKKQGFLDPIALLSKFQRFAQPSEVAAPVELIRLATVLQARGLLNVQAIQHNLDWVWPYWVERQFDPRDPSFIPRAFSLTHINLTHRNWTAVGIPDFPEYPIVDPRGLLTPFYDSWSVDAWIIQNKGEDLLPSRAAKILQNWNFELSPQLITHAEQKTQHLETRVSVEKDGEKPFCILEINAWSEDAAWLAVSLRPFNPEGVSEVQHIRLLPEAVGWEVNKTQRLYFSEPAERYCFSNYKEGDVYRKLSPSHEALCKNPTQIEMDCHAGMATAAAVFKLSPGEMKSMTIQIPLQKSDIKKSKSFIPYKRDEAAKQWQKALAGHGQLQVADSKTQYLYEAALRTLVLHAPGTEVFPGPYTYKQFWFRDACFILHAFLVVNLHQKPEKVLESFAARQTMMGHFRSQDGEWDSNGQVLWIFKRFCELTQTKPKDSWKESLRSGADWILRKRISSDIDAPHAGLLPAGFSAEHLGPNDFYYWDDFWGIEGLRSAAVLMQLYGDEKAAQHYAAGADDFQRSVEKSLAKTAEKLGTQAMPSSPYRRLDTASIGSLGVAYPLSLWEPDDKRVMETVEHLLKNHFINGGFFHEMSHSGINPYLTLTIAQILLRNHDGRYADIVRSVQNLATSSGQWPEAIHPQVLGGCMGDGQHVWAAAEWILMVKNCFLREEKNCLILCSGLLPEWYAGGKAFLEKIATPYGGVTVRLEKEKDGMHVRWESDWAPENEPVMEVRLPGYFPVTIPKNTKDILLKKEDSK